MPSDPENKVEEMLKAYARKRQDEAGPPLELHPVNRKLLQDEVARQRQRPAEGRVPWFSRLLAFWPQLAMTASILVALGITAWVLSRSPGRDDTLLAKRDDAAPAMQEFSKAALPPNEPPSAPRPDSPALSKAKAVEERDRDGMASAEKPVRVVAAPTAPAVESVRRNRGAPPLNRPALTEATPADEEKSRSAGVQPGTAGAGANAPVLTYSLIGSPATNGAIAGRYFSNDRFAPGTPPAPPALTLADTTDAQAQPGLGLATAASKDSPDTKQGLSAKDKSLDDGARLAAAKTGDAYFRQRMAVDGGTSNAGSVRLRFVQTAPLSAAREARTGPETAPAVLSRFEMKQDGAQVQLVDFDGSVYDGWVTASGDSVDALSGTEARTKLPQARKEEIRPQNNTAGAFLFAGAGEKTVAFRVSGISRNLGQPVVVEGTMLVSPEPPAVLDAPTPPTAPSRAPSQVPAKPLGARPTASLGNGMGRVTATNWIKVQRVVGKVRIGPTNEIRLDAVPAKN